ncbi:hypothetical protein ACHAW5_008246 [Stephanodiscus triporus]|uniref:Tyrosine specific protein phosphatases domain-containing protein n=1 Tax=Stephanodiscus triporus TaxID=2934178 RepID=A0ABD3PXN0_9STRA
MDRTIPSNSAGEVLPGLWVGNFMSVFHLGYLAKKSTKIGSSSTDKVVVTVISVLSNPNLILLVTNALKEQQRLQSDATNNSSDNQSRRIYYIDIINHKVFPLKDTVDSDLSSLLPDSLTAIDEALGKNITPLSPSTNNCLLNDFNQDNDKCHNLQRICLVHCAKGVSRSVSVIVAYLLSRHSDRFHTFDEALQHVRTVRPQAMPNVGFAMELRNPSSGVSGSRRRDGCDKVEDMPEETT